MQDKMIKLLEQIDMKHNFLENASINKIIVYDKKNLWEFCIDNDKVLPIYIYDELCNKLKRTFKNIDDIIVNITTSDNNNEFLNDYFDKIISHLTNKSIIYKSFYDRKLNVKDNYYEFEVYNKAENKYLLEKL